MASFSIRSQDICGSASRREPQCDATSATRSGLMSLSHIKHITPITHICSLFLRLARWYVRNPPLLQARQCCSKIIFSC